MHRIGQLQPVAAEDGGNRLFFLRCSKTISVANCFPPASPNADTVPGKQKAPRRALLKALELLTSNWSGRRDSNSRP